LPPAVFIAGAVTVLALPSAVLALSTRLDTSPAGFAASPGVGALAPDRIDSRLMRAISERAAQVGALFRFTPAGIAARPDRSVTVAVRVDPETARTIIVRASASQLAEAAIAPSLTALRITPTAYSLGVSRGYQGFAQGTDAPAPANLALADIKHIEMPDLAKFGQNQIQADGTATPARLAPHIALDGREPAGRASRTLEASGAQTVDLGGSYRVSRNLDVTAGVRYSRDPERLQSLTDGKTDTQAVFVGTQFKF
jgi:hypothetical protein